MSRYSDAEIKAVYRVIAERRDMRHFLPDPVEPKILRRILEAAHQAPSVGLMQPWRLIRITELELRKHIHALVDEERIATARALGEREEEFMALKVEGILQSGELIVAALMDGRERHVFGRRTMPEMDLASVSCAAQNMWLSARAEGLGMGWVSIFDPDKLGALLKMPEGARPVGIFCLGHVEKFYEKPMLEIENWAEGASLDDVLFHNQWKEENQEGQD